MEKRRIRRSREEWIQIMKDHAAFDGSVKKFCAANQISYGTFKVWEKRLRNDSVGENPSFLPVKVVQSPLNASTQTHLYLPGGVTIELCTLPNPHWLAELSAAYEARLR